MYIHLSLLPSFLLCVYTQMCVCVCVYVCVCVCVWRSRLGCQVIITEDMDGMEIQLPDATRNFSVDGHKPAHH